MLNLLAKFTFGDSVITTLIGVSIVFIVLLILIGFIIAIRETIGLFGRLASKKKQNVEATVVSNDEDEEIVAVISAAISEYYQAQNNGRKTKVGFVIKSINRN